MDRSTLQAQYDRTERDLHAIGEEALSFPRHLITQRQARWDEYDRLTDILIRLREALAENFAE